MKDLDTPLKEISNKTKVNKEIIRNNNQCLNKFNNLNNINNMFKALILTDLTHKNNNNLVTITLGLIMPTLINSHHSSTINILKNIKM